MVLGGLQAGDERLVLVFGVVCGLVCVCVLALVVCLVLVLRRITVKPARSRDLEKTTTKYLSYPAHQDNTDHCVTAHHHQQEDWNDDYQRMINVRVASPLSSDRQHLSCDVCLEARGEIIRTVLFRIVY